MNRISLSLAFPIYNEEKNVENCINEHVRELEKIQHHLSSWEIVCLDDASTDQTPQILINLAKRLPHLKMIRHSQNKGISLTYQDLFKATTGDYIYQTACDGQWPAANLTHMLEHLIQSNLDLVVGVRNNRSQIYSPWRLMLLLTFNFLPQILLGIKTLDANGIKLGRREIFDTSLVSKSFFIEIERIARAKRNGSRIGFSPVEFLPRGGGKASGAKWKNIFSSLRDCIRYAFAYHLKSLRPPSSP